MIMTMHDNDDLLFVSVTRSMMGSWKTCMIELMLYDLEYMHDELVSFNFCFTFPSP